MGIRLDPLDNVHLGRAFLQRSPSSRLMEGSSTRPGHVCCSPSCESGMTISLSCYVLADSRQFVDPLILMRVLRTEAHRRISNLIAEKSMHRKFIGSLAEAMGSIPVGRALDNTKPGKGKIYLPSPAKDPLVVRGNGTDFEKQAQKGGLLVLPTISGNAANAEILDIHGPEEILLKREFKGEDALKQLTGLNNINGAIELAPGFEGIEYKTAPKVDQTKVYDSVFHRIQHGGCVCIFPEGGSHDRTELLPLKRTCILLHAAWKLTMALAGLAIMALGALAEHPECGLKIVPCGMNYFHAHKFRSRAVVEFGTPIEVPTNLVDMFRQGERREATRQLLQIVYDALVAVTVTSPDYDTLMVSGAKALEFCTDVARAYPSNSPSIQAEREKASPTRDR